MRVYTDPEVTALKQQGWDSLDTTFETSYKTHWTKKHAAAGARVTREPVRVTAAPSAGGGAVLSWADLATRAKEAGIPNYQTYSKAMLRRMLGL